jgi:hypothetical protein
MMNVHPTVPCCGRTRHRLTQRPSPPRVAARQGQWQGQLTTVTPSDSRGSWAQVVGVIYAVQFLARRLVFAEDRAQTFGDIQRLLKDKIAAGEAGADLRRLADTVLAVDSAEGIADRAADSVRSAAASAGSNGSTPPNVAEARAWIAAWKAKSAKKTPGSHPITV